MKRIRLPARHKRVIEARVTIQRPVNDVFNFYHELRNLPIFLGDVMAIEQISPAISRWTIQGPLGIRAHWTVRLTAECPNELICYETVAPPGLRTYWEIHFAVGSTADETEVREVMRPPLGRLGRAALALIGKFPAEEVSSNLHRLKQVMENGKVTDAGNSVAGKFTRRAR